MIFKGYQLQELKNTSANKSNDRSYKNNSSNLVSSDKSPEALNTRGLVEIANNSSEVKKLEAIQLMINNNQKDNNMVNPTIQFVEPLTYYSGRPLLNAEPQRYGMSCWAACIALLTGIRQVDIINRFRQQHYHINGLPPRQDYNVLTQTYGLRRAENVDEAITVNSVEAMIANNHHWVVTTALTIDQENGDKIGIEYWDPYTGLINSMDWQMFFDFFQPLAAYKI